MNLLVVIPAYNEEASLPRVIEGLRRTCPEYDCLVVNDGSKDATAEVCRQLGVPLLDLPTNLGLAGAFQAGLLYAAAKGYDAAVQFDADGQHLPQYLRAMARHMEEKNCDIVIGSRFVTVKKPKSLRMFGSYLISFAMRLTTRQAVCDPTSGMRMFNRSMILQFAQHLNYAPEPDTICHLIKCGARVCEIQVEMTERLAGTSYFNFWRSARYMAEMAVSILLVQWFRKNDIKNLRAGEEEANG